MIEPIVNGLIFFEKQPRLEAFVQLFETHLWPSYRFHSRIEDGHWIAQDEVMNREYHFSERDVADEAGIDAYVQEAMFEALDRDRPLWRLILLKARPPARSAVLMRLHHVIGDGLGLIFALSPHMGCEGGDPIATMPLPKIMLPPSKKGAVSKAAAPAGTDEPKKCCGPIGQACSNLGSFMKGATVVLTAKHDSELVLNPPLSERSPFLPFNGRRVYTRFPPVPMSTVKAVSRRHGCSVNDVLMAALTGALRRYGAEVGGDPRLRGDERLEFKSLVMIALPRPIDEKDMMTALCNNILFASCPLPIDSPSAEGRLSEVMKAFGNLKSKAYMAGMISLTKFLSGTVPTGMLRKAASEAFSKHSLLVTNVPGPTIPLTFPKIGGEVVSEVHMVFPNVVPQVSFVSYNGAVFSNVVADPQLYREPAKLGEMFVSEFDVLMKCPTVQPP